MIYHERLWQYFNEYIAENATKSSISKGEEYYWDNNIISHSYNSTTQKILFQILGSGLYIVSFKIENNLEIKISDNCCSCPYEGWGICKHQVAAIYWIKE